MKRYLDWNKMRAKLRLSQKPGPRANPQCTKKDVKCDSNCIFYAKIAVLMVHKMFNGFKVRQIFVVTFMVRQLKKIGKNLV